MPFEQWPPVVADVVLPILGIVVIGLLGLRGSRLFVHGIVKALLDREASEGTARELSALEIQKRMDTIETLGARVLQGFVLVIAMLMVLGRFGYDLGPAIAGLGVIGIAVGFGAQSLVRDYFNGVLILIENQYSIGDVVSIGGVSGLVEDLTLRRTVLRDLDGAVHTVPNGEVKVSTNRTRTWARINQDVTVSHQADLEQAIGVVDRVGAELAADPLWKRRLLEAPRVERVDAIGEYGITLKILGRVRPLDQWAAAGELRRRLLDAFNREGIEIPRLQRVMLARDSTGPEPALPTSPRPAGAEASPQKGPA